MYAGIDAGSRAIKVVVLDGDGATVVASGCADQGPRPGPQSDEFYDGVLAGNGLKRRDVKFAVATGYARASVKAADVTVTEITCHARGVRHVAPEARTIIEIGGQDSKLLRLEAGGAVRDFAMNDRCAAGTGQFLELVATRLNCRLEDLSDLARGSTRPCAISSMCAVFAETEIIGLLAGGQSPRDIVAGVQAAIASRIMAMAGGNVTAPVYFTGGVARLAGMDLALASALGAPVQVVPRPHMTGALGAAILAAQRNR